MEEVIFRKDRALSPDPRLHPGSPSWYHSCNTQGPYPDPSNPGGEIYAVGSWITPEQHRTEEEHRVHQSQQRDNKREEASDLLPNHDRGGITDRISPLCLKQVLTTARCCDQSSKPASIGYEQDS